MTGPVATLKVLITYKTFIEKGPYWTVLVSFGLLTIVIYGIKFYGMDSFL